MVAAHVDMIYVDPGSMQNFGIAAGDRPIRETGPSGAGRVRDRRRVAVGCGVCPRGGQRPGGPVRSRHTDVREVHQGDAGPECHSRSQGKKPAACDRGAVGGCRVTRADPTARNGRPGSRGRRDHDRGPSGSEHIPDQRFASHHDRGLRPPHGRPRRQPDPYEYRHDRSRSGAAAREAPPDGHAGGPDQGREGNARSGTRGASRNSWR